MNILDIIAIIPILWGAFKGFKNGLLTEGGTMIGLILGIWAAVHLSENFTKYIQEYTSISPDYQQIAAFAGTFLLALIACFIITRILLRFCKAINILWLDKVLGIAFGMSKYIIILAFIFFLINTLVKSYATKPVKTIEESILFIPLADVAESCIDGKITVPKIEKQSIDIFDSIKKGNGDENK